MKDYTASQLQFRMPIPPDVIRRLILVINYLVNEYLPPLEHAITDGHLDDNALRQVENILTQKRRNDVLQIFRQTMAGNFALLEVSERRLYNLNPFYNERHRYRFTQNNKPVRQETSQPTENGNIVATNTQDRAQNNERYCGPVLSRSSAPRPREARDARTSRLQAEQREKRQLRSPQRSVLPQPSAPLSNPPPEEPREPLRCCIRGQNIQATRRVWFEIIEILKKLGPHQLRAFVGVVNAYDPSVLNSIQFNPATPSDELVNDMIWSLQRCHLTGSKCVLCLLNYVLQRIGRLDLAIEIRMIRYQFCVVPSVL